MTCDETYLLGDDGLYAELGYTGLSRGRDTNRLCAVAGAWDAEPSKTDNPLEHVRVALGISHAQTAAIDIDREQPTVRHGHSIGR